MMDGQFGYRIDLEKRETLMAMSVDFRPRVEGLFSEPEEIDPRPWHRIENQKSMGSCQGHALTSVCEFAYHIGSGEVIQFSPLWAYYATQEIDGIHGDNGSTISGGAKLAREKGMRRLEVMPYPDPVRYTGKIPQEARDAEPFKIKSTSLMKSYSDVKLFIASGQGGVELGISWGGMQITSEGTIEEFRPGSGGHAICFLGYSKRKDTEGRNYLWLANSWSGTWGKAGYVEVAPRAVEQMFRHPHTVMIGHSDMETPTVRPYSFLEHPLI